MIAAITANAAIRVTAIAELMDAATAGSPGLLKIVEVLSAEHVAISLNLSFSSEHTVQLLLVRVTANVLLIS